MSRRAYLPIAVELPSRKGVTFEVLPAGTCNRVTVYQRTRAGLRRVKSPEIVQRVVKEIERQDKAKDVLSQVHRAEQAAAPKRKAPTPPPPREVRRVLRKGMSLQPGSGALRLLPKGSE